MAVLPKAGSVVIPLEKFAEYALNRKSSPDKAKAFEAALGYRGRDAALLIENIRDNISLFNAVNKGQNQYGGRYEVLMRLTGKNGKTANVMTAWIDDKATGEMRLTSACVKKKRREPVD